jgi:hypothetical protein
MSLLLLRLTLLVFLTLTGSFLSVLVLLVVGKQLTKSIVLLGGELNLTNIHAGGIKLDVHVSHGLYLTLFSKHLVDLVVTLLLRLTLLLVLTHALLSCCNRVLAILNRLLHCLCNLLGLTLLLHLSLLLQTSLLLLLNLSLLLLLALSQLLLKLLSLLNQLSYLLLHLGLLLLSLLLLALILLTLILLSLLLLALILLTLILLSLLLLTLILLTLLLVLLSSLLLTLVFALVFFGFFLLFLHVLEELRRNLAGLLLFLLTLLVLLLRSLYLLLVLLLLVILSSETSVRSHHLSIWQIHKGEALILKLSCRGVPRKHLTSNSHAKSGLLRNHFFRSRFFGMVESVGPHLRHADLVTLHLTPGVLGFPSSSGWMNVLSEVRRGTDHILIGARLLIDVILIHQIGVGDFQTSPLGDIMYVPS